MASARRLHCPRCAEAMDVMEHGGVALDRCARCNGLWLDGSEWKPILGPAAEADVTTQRPGSGQSPCPACAEATPFGQESPQLVAQSLLGVADITIDACPSCAGAWLDGGELPRIRAQLASRWAGRARPVSPALAPTGSSQAPEGDGRYLTMGAALLDTLGDVLLVMGQPRRRRGFGGLFSRRPRRHAGGLLFAWLGSLLKRR